jgi:hypothetical protein
VFRRKRKRLLWNFSSHPLDRLTLGTNPCSRVTEHCADPLAERRPVKSLSRDGRVSLGIRWADNEFGANPTSRGRTPDVRCRDKLIPVFVSADEQRDYGKELEEWRGNRFKTEYLPRVRPFSAVPDLLRRVRHAGLQIAVASSAKKDEVDQYLEIAGIADLVDLKNVFGRCKRIQTGTGYLRDRSQEA